MAVRNILLRITGDPSDAKRALAETANDLRKIDGLEANARVALKDEAVKAQIAVVQARLERLGAQEATPKVKIAMGKAIEELERLEAKLEKLASQVVEVDVEIDLDIQGGAGAAVAGALAGIGVAARGAVSGLSAVTSGIAAFAAAAAAGVPAVSQLIALGASVGPAVAVVALLLPLLAALIASFAAAAAGAAALGIALAGAFGPVALVAVVAITKLVGALKAAKEHSDGVASAAKQQAGAAAAIVSAQDGVRSATDGVAQAQANLEQQTTAAWRAWGDAIEAVKDGILGVEHAELGIDEANLSLREAQRALKDFQAEAGLAGDALGSVFEKFTDVSVDTSGLRAAITAASGASGGVSEGDELKLERLILNVRAAKLGEKDATDKLSDSTRELGRLRSTAADYAERGIAAYGPYTAAVQAATDANRALAASNDRLAEARKQPALIAAENPAPALSKSEAALVAVIGRVKKLVADAFGPALTAIFAGAAVGLDEFAKGFKDPRIKASLTDIGEAIGSVFVSLGKLFATKEFRDGFVELAKGGAELVRILGSRIFADFARLMLRIAVAALPDLLDLFDRLATKLHLFVQSTRDGERFRKQIHDLINETRAWMRATIAIGKVLVDVVSFLKDVATTAKKVWKAYTGSAERANDAIEIKVSDTIRNIKNRWEQFKDAFGPIGRSIGRAFSRGFSSGIGAIERIAKGVINTVIGVLNGFIGKINRVTSGTGAAALAKALGGDIHIEPIEKMASGGIATRSILANIGEAGKEAVLPLTTNVLRQLGLAIHAATVPALRAGALTPAFAGAGGSGGTRIGQMHVNVKTPAGELPDAQTTAVAISRLVERKFGGDTGQD